MALREITTRLLCNRQWKDFWEPVDPQEDPEFYEQVAELGPLKLNNGRRILLGSFPVQARWLLGHTSGIQVHTCQ